QCDDFRHPQPHGYGLDEQFAVARTKTGPVLPVVELEAIGIDHACRIVPQQNKSPRHRRDVNGLTVAVKVERRALGNIGCHVCTASSKLYCAPSTKEMEP